MNNEETYKKLEVVASKWMYANIGNQAIDKVEYMTVNDDVRKGWTFRVKNNHVEVIYKEADDVDLLIAKSEDMAWCRAKHVLWFFFDSNQKLLLVLSG